MGRLKPCSPYIKYSMAFLAFTWLFLEEKAREKASIGSSIHRVLWPAAPHDAPHSEFFFKIPCGAHVKKLNFLEPDLDPFPWLSPRPPASPTAGRPETAYACD